MKARLSTGMADSTREIVSHQQLTVIGRCTSSWWSLGLQDDIICASYLWVREWLCRPILDLQSHAQSGHWKFAFVAGIEAAKWRRSLADCAWWRRSASSANDADCLSVCQRCLSRAVATSLVGGMPHCCKPAFTVSLKCLQGRPRKIMYSHV